MEKYGKIVNEEIQFAPDRIENEGSITYNPSYEMLQPLGYLPIKFTKMPETNEGYCAVCSWSENNGEIIQEWNIIETAPTAEDILNILIGDNAND